MRTLKYMYRNGSMLKLVLFYEICLSVTYALCGGMRDFRNIFNWTQPHEVVMIDMFFERHNCSAYVDALSFQECLEKCSRLSGCVGLAHIHNDCMMCHNDTQSNQIVPKPLQQHYLLLTDHMFAMPKHRDCRELQDHGYTLDGVYTIDPDGSGEFEVYCELNPDRTDGTINPGWTVIQRRIDGSVDFYRGWDEYNEGFGDLNGNFWLGLTKIHRLLTSPRTILHVNLEGFDGTNAYAHYSSFAVTDASDKFKLTVTGYTGTAGDSLANHNGLQFSTYDNDNDGHSDNCALKHGGAWWYNSCHDSNLNGYYYTYDSVAHGMGIQWKDFKGYYYSLKHAVMKIKRR